MNKREKLGYLEGFVSIILNIGLFALKYWAGIVSGSIALMADAWHTLSDSLSSVVVIAGVKLSSRKPDRKHVFGHGRWEQISAFFIAFLLSLIAYEFLKESIEKFSARGTANFGTIAIVVTVISILVKEGLAQFAFKIWKKTGNVALKADGWHHRTDALSSILVLAGIFLKDVFWWIDSALGILISLMIFYAVFRIIKETIDKLLGEAPDEEFIEKISGMICKLGHPKLVPHHFHIHDYGDHKELTFHINLEGDMNIRDGHKISSEIEELLRKELGIESTIHVDPM